MNEISLNRNELSAAVSDIKNVGSKFGRQTLNFSGRKTTLTAADLLNKTFVLMENSFVSAGESVFQAAAALSDSGEMIIEKDDTLAGGF